MSGNFTKRQKRLIKYLKEGGFGWRKFATNVEKQGYCSPKQEDTMCNMHQKLSSQRRFGELRKTRGGIRHEGCEMHENIYEWDNRGGSEAYY